MGRVWSASSIAWLRVVLDAGRDTCTLHNLLFDLRDVQHRISLVLEAPRCNGDRAHLSKCNIAFRAVMFKPIYRQSIHVYPYATQKTWCSRAAFIVYFSPLD